MNIIWPEIKFRRVYDHSGSQIVWRMEHPRTTGPLPARTFIQLDVLARNEAEALKEFQRYIDLTTIATTAAPTTITTTAGLPLHE